MVENGSGLGSKDLSNIRSTVLEGREMIEDEIKRQLEKYGVYPEERLDRDELSHLDMEDIEVRRKIDAAFEREMSATEDEERSYKNYVKEATYNHLNRLFALKVLEERGFITETLKTRPEYGNRSEMQRALSEVVGELCDSEDSGFGDALELAYDELSEEIGIIFEENDYTAINLDFKVKKDIVDLLEDIDSRIWEADETIGWMYQYFGKKEREEIDDKIDEENYKVKDTDIGVKTQLFTPRYIVKWMVDNSLGRLWLEMHPESDINDEENCFYLAPLEESLTDREVKDVKDIKVLDPACGSGHMLFYAFDVLYKMYLEQGDIPEKYIPKRILENNLYGIDIDPYAVQLAALALFIKAKEKEPEVELEQINVVPADAVLINGEKKREILEGLTELDKQVIEEVWDSFENIREYGSLVRIEEKIDDILEEYKEKGSNFAKGQTRLTDEGELEGQSSLNSMGEDDKWPSVKEELLTKVRKLAEKALENNNLVEEMFAGEVEKSVELLDLFVQDYDVVVTNPPYLGSAKIGGNLKKFVKDNYMGNRDLFAAFIERCAEFAGNDGYTSMITPENFMFLYSYRKLRKYLLSNTQLIEGAHLSRYGFAQQKDAYTIPFVLRRRDPSNFETSRFYRMTHEQERYAHYKDKISGLKEITEAHRGGIKHEDVYVVDQNSFREIDRTPFVYWFGQEILQLFLNYQQLGEITDIVQGLGTGDDDRFTRCWWEVDPDKIGNEYRWLITSGDDSIYYYSPERIVNWKKNGQEIKQYDGSRPQNEEYYNKPGITFRRNSKYFTTRLKDPAHIFSYHAHFIYVESKDYQMELLGYLGSSLVRFILQGLNPGLDFNVGDGKRIPVLQEGEYPENIKNFARAGVKIQHKRNQLREMKNEFEEEEFIDSFDRHLFGLEMAQADIEVIHGLIDNIIMDEFKISSQTRTKIYRILPKKLSDYPYITNVGELDTEEYPFRSKVSKKKLLEEEYEELIDDIENIADKDLREISEKLEISPYTVAVAKHKHDFYTDDEKEKAAGRLLSYYLGCILGRWDLEGLESDDNGILVFDQTFEDNIMDRIRECIRLTFDQNPYEKENEIEEMLGKSIEDWMKQKYFRYHHCKEYRRRGQRIPIYWQLSSDEGTIDCFIYYHKMDKDTFPKLKGQYVDKKLERLENRLGSIENKLNDDSLDESKKKELRKEREELTKKVDDLENFAERLEELVREEFKPDFEAGIWKNIQRVDELDLLAVPLDKL